MSSIVAEGEALLAAEAARREAAVQAEAEAQALAELRATAPALIELLNTVVTRLATLEMQGAEIRQMVMATRVRRPVRDDLGTILYVVDELQPPVWASAD